MMKSGLVFYRKLISELNSMGFKIHLYDPCIGNKMMTDSQMTIRWHAYDLMISHANMDEIMEFLHMLKDIYGNSLAESNGKHHDYLDMEFDFLSENEVKIKMTKYVSKSLLTSQKK